MKSLVLGALLAAGIAVTGARAGVIEEFEAEDWDGIAYADDDTGAFHNCIVFAAYRNGGTLMMIRTVENTWAITVAHDAWQLSPDETHRLEYKVDGGRAVQVDAEALNADQLTIAANEGLIEQIRRGKELKIAFDGKEYAFDLANSGKALKAAADCVERHRGTVQQAAASAPEPEAAGPTEAPPAPPAAETEAASPVAEAPAEHGTASTLGDRQTFGHWVVTAVDDGTGNFLNCSAFGLYGDDEQLILSYTPQGKWEFGLWRADWSLPTDSAYFLWYNVDKTVDEPGVMKRPVEAVEPTRIFFEVSSLETLMERAATGQQLNLQLRGVGMEPQSLSYSLDQAGPALEATKACVAGHVAQAETAAAEDDVVVEPESGNDVVAEPEAGDDVVVETDVAAPEAGASGQTQQQVGASASLPEIGGEMIETVEVAGWEAGAFADSSGKFLHCAISAEYQNGTAMRFSRTADGSLVMAFHRTDWNLTPDQLSPIKYQARWEAPGNAVGITGGALQREGQAQAVNENMLAVEIGQDESFVDRLRQSQRLNVEAEGLSLTFDISDLPPGLDAIDDCRERQLAAAQAQAAAPQPQQQAASAPSLPQIGGEKTETLEVPGWDGGAYADEAGAFTHCAISARYQNGAELGFARTADNSLLIAVARSDWQLQPNQWMPIRYSFGQSVPINNEGEAQAVNSALLATNMGRDNMLLEELKQSPELTIEVEGRSLAFDISDLAPGLEAIDACRERHLAAEAGPSADAAPEAESEDDSDILEEFKVEDWNAAAYANDAGGLSHCAAFATYQNGLTLYLVKLPTESWRIGLMNPGKWNLPQDSAVPVQYRIDEHPERTADGIPTGEATLVIDVDAPVMTSEVASGSELVTEVDGERFAFDLGNADKAVPAVEECVVRHGGDAVKPAPKAAAQKAETPTGPAAEEEARRYMADLLTQAGYPEHHMMAGDEVPDGYREYDAVWEIGEITGMLRVRPELAGVELQQVRKEIVAADESICEGEFDSRNLPGGNVFLATVTDTALLFANHCKEPDWEYTGVYSVLPRPGGGYQIVLHLGVADGEAAKAISRKVYETALF